MTKIISCNVKVCSYNMNNQCHTYGITIGEEKPICDTFINNDVKGGMDEITGGIGACKVISCKFNNNFECEHHEGIKIKMNESYADCISYRRIKLI